MKLVIVIMACVYLSSGVTAYPNTCSKNCLQCSRGICRICKNGFMKMKATNQCVEDEYYLHRIIGIASLVLLMVVGGMSLAWILMKKRKEKVAVGGRKKEDVLIMT